MKIILTILMAFTFAITNEREVKAYEYSENAYFVVVGESNLGEVKIYIPKNQVEVLEIGENGTNIINISSGTVYGYFTKGNVDYRVTFGTLSNPTYKESTSSYGTSNIDMNITEIKETNIPNLKSVDDMNGLDYAKVYSDEIMITFFVAIFGMVVLLWLKH